MARQTARAGWSSSSCERRGGVTARGELATDQSSGSGLLAVKPTATQPRRSRSRCSRSSAAALAPSSTTRLKLHRSSGLGEVSTSSVRPQSEANPPKNENGTTPAVSNLSHGEAAFSIPRSGRGGSRLRRDRASYALTSSQTANLIAATAHAQVIGLTFTRMVTIHWQAAGLPLSELPSATGRFVDLLTKTLARHGSRTAWLWTHENKSQRDKGGHCHLLIHVPANLVRVVNRLQRRWLRSITGRPYRRGTICSRPVGGRLGIEKHSPDLHAANLDTALGYLLKGATLETALKFSLRRVEPGGLIIGKRCSTSQNIGLSARNAARRRD
jgi:hypothetical protein